MWPLYNHYYRFEIIGIFRFEITTGKITLETGRQTDPIIIRLSDYSRLHDYFQPIHSCSTNTLFFKAYFSNCIAVDYCGKPTEIGKWYVSVLHRNCHYHPNRFEANYVLLFQSKSLPSKKCVPVPVQIVTAQI